MKITIISGSQRTGSQTLKISKFLEYNLQKLGVSAQIIELATLNLPFSHTEQANKDTESQAKWQSVSDILQDSDGFVIASPEWNGTISPMLMDFFLRCGSELAHKPGLLVGVSSGMGGAFVIPELRIASYKNKFINYIPEHLIIRHVEQMMNSFEIDEQNDSKEDLYIKKRALYALEVLLKYADAMTVMRAGGMPVFPLSRNGMS